MYSLIVAICHVALRIRHARSLKDKRQILKSLTDRLRNLGFSANECGDTDNLKECHIGFSYVGGSSQGVNKIVDEAMRLFQGDFEVLKRDREIFNYEPSDSDDLSWMVGVEDEVKE